MKQFSPETHRYSGSTIHAKVQGSKNGLPGAIVRVTVRLFIQQRFSPSQSHSHREQPPHTGNFKEIAGAQIPKENQPAMVTKFSFKERGRCLRLVCLGLCFVLQVGCGSEMNSRSGLYDDAPCAPAEVVGQLRKALSRQHILTTEPAPEGKGLSLFTDSVESDGQRQRMVRYKVSVQPVENTDKSTIQLQLWEVKAQGFREREQYKEDTTASTPKVEQQIMEQVQNICRAGQPQ